jgi:hypothetical protein
MRDGRPVSVWAPWAGLFLGAAAWFLHHQAGSDANYWDCKVGGAAFIIGLGVACGAVAAFGGAISWAARKPAEGPTAEQNRQFAALVGTAAAAIFLLTIALQTLAGALVPACLR